MRHAISILLLALLSVATLSAQQRVLLSRSALDSLVYPTLSTEARGKVVGTPAKYNLSYAEALQPGDSGKVSLSFNPVGRNGAFSIDVFAYTDIDSDRPTERLTLIGEVRANDNWSHLRYTAGDLRLSRRQVHFKANTEERIVCANAGDKPLRITARSTVDGLTLRTEPEIIAPNTSGAIIISYRAEERSAMTLRTMLILEGVESSPTERMITVTIEK